MNEVPEVFNHADLMLDVGKLVEIFNESARQHGDPFWGSGYSDGLITDQAQRNEAAMAAIHAAVAHPRVWGSLLEAQSLNVLIARTTPKLRKSLMLLAALCCGWIEALDQREAEGVEVPGAPDSESPMSALMRDIEEIFNRD